MELTLNLNTFNSDATNNRIVSSLSKCTIACKIKNIGYVRKNLIIELPDKITNDAILELGVLIGTIESLNRINP